MPKCCLFHHKQRSMQSTNQSVFYFLSVQSKVILDHQKKKGKKKREYPVCLVEVRVCWLISIYKILQQIFLCLFLFVFCFFVCFVCFRVGVGLQFETLKKKLYPKMDLSIITVSPQTAQEMKHIWVMCYIRQYNYEMSCKCIDAQHFLLFGGNLQCSDLLCFVHCF